eukprot:CAMPEP_0115087594 /NCGR_PEP_ID=MMETSP0227-20121206/23405_1 /TAXON_ID=89957 /ORGANISM="Polarella glacialis, Strain CCMP 1383" /LENGTH=83 /DNA_ID=CAMNT_0002477535 /DNA_START=29 /DNA_END=281 /DNA_ORIENTATION=-
MAHPEDEGGPDARPCSETIAAGGACLPQQDVRSFVNGRLQQTSADRPTQSEAGGQSSHQSIMVGSKRALEREAEDARLLRQRQ